MDNLMKLQSCNHTPVPQLKEDTPAVSESSNLFFNSQEIERFIGEFKLSVLNLNEHSYLCFSIAFHLITSTILWKLKFKILFSWLFLYSQSLGTVPGGPVTVNVSFPLSAESSCYFETNEYHLSLHYSVRSVLSATCHSGTSCQSHGAESLSKPISQVKWLVYIRRIKVSPVS